METFKINGEDGSIEKKLMGVSAFYAALSETGQVIMKYRKDEETAWTEIFDDGTNNALSHQSVNIEGTWSNLPVFKEIQLRIEAKGGAELTGWKMRHEELPCKSY